VTELAARSRQHWQAANNSTAYVGMIHGVAVLASNSAPVTESLTRQPTHSFNYSHCGRVDLIDLSRSTSGTDSIKRQRRTRRTALAGSRDRYTGPEAEIVAKCAVGRRRFVVTPTPGATVTLEQRIVAVAVVDVAAAYLVGELHAM